MNDYLGLLKKVYFKLAAGHRLAASLPAQLNGPHRSRALLRLATVHRNLMGDALKVVLSLGGPLEAAELADDERLRMPERDMLMELVDGLGITTGEIDRVVLVEARRQRAEFIEKRKATS